MGNLFSVSKALESLGADIAVSKDAAAFADAEAIVLPGVGHFGDGMRRLNEMGLADPLKAAVRSGKPFLGICLGMQLLMDGSEEAPGVAGLGLVPGKVERFVKSPGLKIPHMGWNTVSPTPAGADWFPPSPDRFFYFVHSYYVKPDDSAVVAGKCEYGVEFAAAIRHDNIFATQFHPEKSQDDGLALLRRFMELGLAE